MFACEKTEVSIVAVLSIFHGLIIKSDNHFTIFIIILIILLPLDDQSFELIKRESNLSQLALGI